MKDIASLSCRYRGQEEERENSSSYLQRTE